MTKEVNISLVPGNSRASEWVENRAKPDTSKPFVRLNAEVPRELHKCAKKYCLDQDISLTEFVISLLEEKFPEARAA